MTPDQEGVFISDVEEITGFVVCHDHAGMKKWLHGLPLGRVETLHAHFGVGHPFSQLITERLQVLIPRAQLTTSLIATSAALRPERETWSFWLAWTGIAIGAAGLVVAILAYLKTP